MIYLSVSSLKDYLACPKRYWWRVKRKEVPVTNEYIFRGQVIHNAIQKFDNVEEAIEFATIQYQVDFLYHGHEPPQDVTKMLTNYYTHIEPKLDVRKPENIEKNFKVKWDDRAYIVGKIDRISENKQELYDWKTGYAKPTAFALQDPQFYIYSWAVSTLYNTVPEVYYGHLSSGKLFKTDINDDMWYNIKYIINKTIDELTEIDYYPRVPAYHCGSCFFETVCWSEL